MPATLTELEFHVKTLEEKIARLKSGELSAQQQEGDGRQESAIHRAEGRLRQVKKEIAVQKKETK